MNRLIGIFFGMGLLLATACMGKDFYVDAAAAAGGGGSSGAPFKTIQQAAAVMQAGDVCWIMEGIYPEQVIPAQSGTADNPIIFQAVPGHHVVVTGSNAVSVDAWEAYSENMYRAQVGMELEYENQVFLGDKMLLPARWPNSSDDLLNPTLAEMDVGTTPEIIVDEELPLTNWYKARVWVHAWRYWSNWTTRVTTHAPGKLYIENIAPFNFQDRRHVTREGARYFVYNTLAVLDADNEWFYDSQDGYLYIFRTDGQLPQDSYYIKKRLNAFNLKDRSHIHLMNLEILGATIDTDISTTQVILDGLRIFYPYFSTEGNQYYGQQHDKGVRIYGTRCKIMNCEIAYSSGNGIMLSGSYNFLYNSYIHDANFIGTQASCVNLAGKGNIISHCTLSRAGRTVLNYGNMYKSLIQYCDMSKSGMLTSDLGLTYGNVFEAGNSEVRFNWLHENLAEHIQNGLYYDHGTQNIITHHNVTWNIPRTALSTNHYAYYHMVYNNTFSSDEDGFKSTWGNQYDPDLYGCRYFNNIFEHGFYSTATNYTAGNNLTDYKEFVDDKYLPAGSEAIDSAILIAGINDNFKGEGPDIGAYEYGGENWKAGHDFDNPPSFDTTRTDLIYMNRLENSAFEHANHVRPWVVSGSTGIEKGNKGQTTPDVEKIRMGRANISLGAGGEILQHVTGLEPGSLYEFAAFLRVDDASPTIIGARDSSGREYLSDTLMGNAPHWQQVIVPLNTGKGETETTVFVKRLHEGGGKAYVDDCGLIFIEKGASVFFKELQSQVLPSADTVVWTSVGPGNSGFSDRMFFHPTDLSTMFMSQPGGKTYMTRDEGLSWKSLYTWNHESDPGSILSMDFSRQDPLFGLALSENGRILKSLDGGCSWESTNVEFPASNSVITVNPADDDNWFIGAGSFWETRSVNHSKEMPHGSKVEGAEYGHIYKSVNAGRSFVKITDRFEGDLDVGRMIVNPLGPDRIYAATNYGFYVSGNGGNNWLKRGSEFPNNRPRDLCSYFHQETGEYILFLLDQTEYSEDGEGSITSSGGVFRSSDGGVSWEDISGNLRIDLTQISDESLIEQYYLAIARWFSLDKGEARERFPELPRAFMPSFNRISVDPKNKDQIYLSADTRHDYAFTPGEFWRSTDGGIHWEISLRYGPYWRQGKDQQYWVSRNNSTGVNVAFTHTAAQREILPERAGCTFLSANGENSVMVNLGQQLLQSKDGGNSWIPVDDFETAPGSNHWVGRGASFVKAGPVAQETGMEHTKFFPSREHGLWISRSDGNKVYPGSLAMERIAHADTAFPVSIFEVNVIPSDTSTWFMLVQQDSKLCFMVTSDAGETWETRSFPVAWEKNATQPVIPTSLIIDPSDPSNIYFCVPSWIRRTESHGSFVRNGPDTFEDHGIYRSLDGGLNWDLLSAGLPPGTSVRNIITDPSDPKLLYAALSSDPGGQSGGLYRSLNGGTQWDAMELPEEILSVNHIHVNRNSGAMYLSTGREEGTLEEAGSWVSEDGGQTFHKIFDFPNILQTTSSYSYPEVLTVLAGPSVLLKNLNAGAYLSTDSGENWIKVNQGLDLPLQIQSLCPDPHDPDVLWCALAQSGWYKGSVKPGIVASAEGHSVFQGDTVILDASSSFGENLSFSWTLPPGWEVLADEGAYLTCVAPEVDEHSLYDILLEVSSGTSIDRKWINVLVKPVTALGQIFYSTHHISVFPNPAKDWFLLKGIEGRGILELYNLQGRKVLQRSIHSTKRLDITFLSPGLYTGIFKSGTERYCFKLLRP